MNNKVLVELIVPEIDKRFSVFLPANKKIGNIIIILNKAIHELDNNHVKSGNSLYNWETGQKYKIDILLYNTDIRGGTALVLFWYLKGLISKNVNKIRIYIFFVNIVEITLMGMI